MKIGGFSTQKAVRRSSTMPPAPRSPKEGRQQNCRKGCKSTPKYRARVVARPRACLLQAASGDSTSIVVLVALHDATPRSGSQRERQVLWMDARRRRQVWHILIWICLDWWFGISLRAENLRLARWATLRFISNTTCRKVSVNIRKNFYENRQTGLRILIQFS